MGVQFFGHYLLKRDVITREQLLEAVAYQEEHNHKIGEFAIERGLLSQEQVSQLLSQQRSTDLLFGKLAIEQGLLSAEQGQELIEMHSKQHMFLGQALVEKGFLDGDTLKRELDAFSQEQRKHRQDLVATYGNRGGGEAILAHCTDITVKYMLRLANLTALARDIKPYMRLTPVDGCLTSTSLGGDIEATVHFLFSHEVARRFATKQAAEPDSAAVTQGVLDFCQVALAHLQTRLVEEHKTIEVKQSQIVDSPIAPRLGPKLLVAPLLVASGVAMVGLDIRAD